MKKLYTVLAAGMLVAVGGLSHAAGPSTDGTINGCYDKVSGQLRVASSAPTTAPWSAPSCR
jgi:hypothetical protein